MPAGVREAIVLKALEKDPKERFATAAEMQRALDQVASSLGTPVSEEEVAAFVRKAIGESLTKRSPELRRRWSAPRPSRRRATPTRRPR